jgi:ABC-2 type transport system permease protein
MRTILTELSFAFACFKMNIASAMEYRASFISQVVFMIINDAIYFVFWWLFFDRFKEVRGWAMDDMFLVFAIITVGFGLGFGIFGNARTLPRLIAEGRLDYYLALPRNVLLHVLVTRSSLSAWGDFAFGLMAYLFTGRFSVPEITLFLVASLCAGTVLVSFAVLAGSLTFFIGNAAQISEQAMNAMLTFALYPANIFEGAVKFLMFTLVPAAFVGAIPARLVSDFSWEKLVALTGFSVFITLLAATVFYTGLRRYESGSALHVNL